MVRLHVKKGDESQFLYDASVEDGVDSVINNITIIYNGRLKISRICYEIEELAKHGTMLPHEMMGLTDEQIEELKLKDEWAEKSTPMGGWTFNKDVIGRRNGRQPNEKMQEVLKKAIQDARTMTSKKLVQQDKLVTQKIVQEALDILRGAVTIVYPMGLPPHDVIRQEFENNEDLTGTQASLEVMDVQTAQLWFSGKEMLREKKLKDFLGRNEKSKVIVKLHKRGSGKPAREPLMSEDERKQLMLHAYRRQEELKDHSLPIAITCIIDDAIYEQDWLDTRIENSESCVSVHTFYIDLIRISSTTFGYSRHPPSISWIRVNYMSTSIHDDPPTSNKINWFRPSFSRLNRRLKLF